MLADRSSCTLTYRVVTARENLQVPRVRCPYCHFDNDRVLDTRPAEGGFTIRRKRICTSCNRKFATAETIEKLNVLIVKTDDTREPLDPDKIRRGISRACSKRPIDREMIDRLVQDIEADIFSNYDSEVTSSQVGDIVMKHLVKLDEVAYIRFASVYYEFNDAQDFVLAVSKMIGPTMAASG